MYQRIYHPSRIAEANVMLNWLHSQNSSYERQLDECVIELNISLITYRNDTFSAPNQTLLTYYIGILSLDIDQGSASHLLFVPTSQSTSLLSNLIWICRLFILEYALPKQAYLASHWPSRDSYSQPFRRLQAIRKKYLITNELTPISEICRLRELELRLQDRDIERCILY
ncbi:hypothetical protein B0O99DRAFT_148011 [Bisporella sp. PMI_857]|nr:hypothetical protein B0O99DRAFT_148011 [Bisporella sp. PMI_857]